MLHAAGFVLIIRLLGLLQPVISVEVPAVACPQYFVYYKSNGKEAYWGRIIIPYVSLGETVVEVEFQQKVLYEGDAGGLSLDEDKNTTHYKIENNLPLNYRVDFPIPSVLPKLTALRLNGRLICSATGYEGSSVTMSMQHTLRTSVQTICGNCHSPAPTTHKPQVVLPRISAQKSVGTTVCGEEGTVTPYIYLGNDIAPGQYPWLTAVLKKTDNRLDYKCSGSLISARAVITAAHCIHLGQLQNTNTIVQLGRHFLFQSEKYALQVNIETILENPEYDNSKMSDADLALLIMATRIAFTDVIRPICLWSESDDINLIVNQTGMVAGWGSLENGIDISPVPKVAPASIVSENQCLRSSNWYRRYTTSRTICGGQQDGVGPCVGDSGGGLMLKRNGVWSLRGIVSLGQTRIKDNKRQCDLSHYVIYCDLAKHRKWVEDNWLA